MTPINYLVVIREQIKKIIVGGLIVAFVSGALSFLRPLEYRSTIRLLIVSQETLGLDPYLALRASERIAENLASVIYTTSFFEKVLISDPAIDQSYFNPREEKKRRQWTRLVSTEISRGGSLLSLAAYHRDRAQAERLIMAIGQVIQNEGWTYVAGGNLSIKVVDNPLTSRYPARPNVPANFLTGLVLGMMAGATWFSWRARQQRQNYSRGFLHEI